MGILDLGENESILSACVLCLCVPVSTAKYLWVGREQLEKASV
jgi:hypothetical protein